MLKSVTTSIVCLFLSWSVAAADAAKIVGTYKLVSFATEFQDGSASRQVLGANAKGFLVMTAEGRQIVYMESEGRTAAKTDEERAKLFTSMLAWTGIFRVDGEKFILKVDASWNPAVTGTERVSTFKLDGNRLSFTAPWAPSPILPGNPITRGVSVWERVK